MMKDYVRECIMSTNITDCILHMKKDIDDVLLIRNVMNMFKACILRFVVAYSTPIVAATYHPTTSCPSGWVECCFDMESLLVMAICLDQKIIRKFVE